MLTESDIKSITAERTFQRGKQLYMYGNVQNIQILDVYAEERKCKKVKAFVQGSTWRCYNVDITVDEEENRVVSNQCDCPAHSEYAGLCKHAVATMLRFVQVRKDQEKKLQEPAKKITVEFPDRTKLEELDAKTGLIRGENFWGKRGMKTPTSPTTKKEGSMPRTDYELYRLLMDHSLDRQVKYKQIDVNGKVRIEPILHNYNGRATVEFKIGITQMYVMKNVVEFVNALKQNEKKYYGAKLDFYHHISAFEEDSIPLVRFLQEVIPDLYSRSAFHTHQYYTKNDAKREISLQGVHLDHFMEAVVDREIEVIDYYGENGPCKVSYGEPDMPLRIEGVASGIRMSARYYDLINGATNQYVIDIRKQAIHIVDLKSIRKIQAFREYMNRLIGKSTFLAESELPVFCRDLLPELEKHYEIDMREFNPSRYLPEKVSFEIYLDMPTFDEITCQLKAVYGEEKYDVFQIENASRFMDFGHSVITEKRDVQQEMEVDAAVSRFFPYPDLAQRQKVLMGNADEIYDFLSEGIHSLEQIGEVFISENMKKVQILKTPAFHMGVSLKSNLLQLSLDSKDMPLEQLTEILTKYNRKKKYFRLKDGSFINMQDEEMMSLVSLVDGLQLNPNQLKKGDMVIPKYRALYLDLVSREDDITYMQKDKDFKQLVRNMKSVEENDYEIPESLDQIMRSYQKSGFRWLKTLHANGFGGILADDMGLGKTLQVIAFLQSELGDDTITSVLGENRRTLIVCPASLVYNWQSEIERFAPMLKTIMVTGDAATRKELVVHSTEKDILITSYDLLKRDIENYENVDFFCEIIDEAQFIKNQNTQAAKAVKLIKAGTKFALTGTPMENRLSELWSIFDYLMPGFLFGYKQFKEEVESPIVELHNEEAMLKLRRFITPFVLRRLKKDVLKDLPDKLEEVVYAKMEDEQQELYAANAQKLKMLLDKQTPEEFATSKIQLLAELTRLRQICCNPQLIYENYKGASAKTEVCMELLQNAIEGGHKVLVFSQFTSMLELLVKAADKAGISYYMLTGQTSKEQRMEMVEAFNQNDTSVFFISLKAGGTGLNLTSADIVIHFDPWWNLAAQNQATDRTHRIGQKNVVTVYKLIAKNTIEERIVKLQEMKQELADQVLGGENMDKPTFSKEELLELLG